MLTSTTSTNNEMKQMLDSIDSVRSALAELKGTSGADQFYEELLSSLPQFVACGPQSAGKSSVIRRISGIALPEASTLCTRVATLVQMRRRNTTSIRVTLLGPDSFKSEETCDLNGVRECVEKAQSTAVARSPGNKAFVEDYTIQVTVVGPDKPNVTLVDLPGFHTSNDADTKVVNDMVKRYVEMPGTLVLHVIKGDQDYGSVLGNDFMRHAGQDNNRVTVLTHCDKLDLTDATDIERLQSTITTTAEHSSLTVAVHGGAVDDADECTKLDNLVQSSEVAVDVGALQLREHLEERMREHLELQYPKAIEKLNTTLAATLERLELVKEQTPADVLFQMTRTISENLDKKKNGLMNKMRDLLEGMTCEIRNFRLEPLSEGVKRTVKAIDEFDETLEVGSTLYAPDLLGGESLATVYRATISVKSYAKCSGGPNYFKVKDADGIEREVEVSSCFSGESLSVSSICEDILQLAKDRGMRNLVHIDRQPIIACYAQAFAKHYTKSIRQTVQETHQMLSTMLDSVFGEQIPEIARPAARQLRFRMRAEEQGLLELACTAVEAIKEHNSETDLLFTPNEHYLNDLIKRMVEKDEEMATDTGGARHIYHNVRAYLKVQRKFISELAAKELIRILVLGTFKRVRKLLSSTISELTKFVKEPNKLVKERENLTLRKKVLEGALSQVPMMFAMNKRR